MAYIANMQLEPNGPILPIGSTLFGTCSTGMAAPEKIVDIPGFALTSASTFEDDGEIDNGITIHVYFSRANNVTSNISLNINSLGARPVLNPSGALTWKANSVISFTYYNQYNGGTWFMNSSGNTQITAADLQRILGDLKLMSFKGTINTDDELPYDANNGDTYKVIADHYDVYFDNSGTGETFTAKAGDLLIAVVEEGEVKWVLIPSGDDSDIFIEKQITGPNSTKFIQGNGEYKNLVAENIFAINEEGVLDIYQTAMVNAQAE